jgi:hypothetical protein
MKESGEFSEEARKQRGIESSKRADALDEANLGQSCTGDIKLCCGDSAGVSQHRRILAVACNRTGAIVERFCKCPDRSDAEGQPVPVGIAPRSFFTSDRAGPGAPSRVKPVGGTLPFTGHG